MKTKSRIPALSSNSIIGIHRWFHKMHNSGLLYHPDDPAESIVNISNGQPTFTPEECKNLNNSFRTMFENHGDKVYQVALHYFHKAMGIKPEYI